MPDIDRNDILARLKSVAGPDGTSDIVTLGLVSDIIVSGGKVMFSITVPAERAAALEPLRQRAEAAVRAIPGVAG